MDPIDVDRETEVDFSELPYELKNIGQAGLPISKFPYGKGPDMVNIGVVLGESDGLGTREEVNFRFRMAVADRSDGLGSHDQIADSGNENDCYDLLLSAHLHGSHTSTQLSHFGSWGQLIENIVVAPFDFICGNAHSLQSVTKFVCITVILEDESRLPAACNKTGILRISK